MLLTRKNLFILLIPFVNFTFWLSKIDFCIKTFHVEWINNVWLNVTIMGCEFVVSTEENFLSNLLIYNDVHIFTCLSCLSRWALFGLLSTIKIFRQKKSCQFHHLCLFDFMQKKQENLMILFLGKLNFGLVWTMLGFFGPCRVTFYNQ